MRFGDHLLFAFETSVIAASLAMSAESDVPSTSAVTMAPSTRASAHSGQNAQNGTKHLLLAVKREKTWEKLTRILLNFMPEDNHNLENDQ
jgi:hypothetical protein